MMVLDDAELLPTGSRVPNPPPVPPKQEKTNLMVAPEDHRVRWDSLILRGNHGCLNKARGLSSGRRTACAKGGQKTKQHFGSPQKMAASPSPTPPAAPSFHFLHLSSAESHLFPLLKHLRTKTWWVCARVLFHFFFFFPARNT